jgi:hypothetical protein
MGQTTPKMGIFIPVAGETNYESSFASGMLNIDKHDHTGAPTGGSLITTTGLTDESVTYVKLNSNVADAATGIGVDPANPNKLQILGLLRQIFALAPLANGELIIGSTGVSPVKAIPNAGVVSALSGINVTVGAGSLLFESTLAVKITRVETTIANLPISVGMTYCVIECLGGGGGGGGTAGPGAGLCGGGGGGSGEYSRAVFTQAQVGTAYNITIGAAGAAGASGGASNGGDGGATSVTSVGGSGGILIASAGGKGGLGSVLIDAVNSTAGGLGGTTAPDGLFRVSGYSGGNSFGATSGMTAICSGGVGAPSYFGGSNIGVVVVGIGPSINGNAALSYGAGGGGGAMTGNNPTSGGVGFAGVVIITEYYYT